MKTSNTYTRKIIDDLVISSLPKFFIPVLIPLICWFLLGKLSKTVVQTFLTTKVSQRLKTLTILFFITGLKLTLVIIIVGAVGIEAVSLIALLTATYFSIRLVTQGNSSSFTTEILVLLFRPLKLGNLAIIRGNWVFVREMQFFYSLLPRDSDNTTSFIFNSIIICERFQNNPCLKKRDPSSKFNILDAEFKNT